MEGTSMTQQAASVRNLDDRFRTAFESLAILQALHGGRLVTVRLIQYMNHDFAHSMRMLGDAIDDEFWATLRSRVGQAAQAVSARHAWGAVRPAQRVLTWLILADRRLDAARFLSDGGHAEGDAPLTGNPLLPLVRLPLFDDRTIPRWLFRATPGQTLRWARSGALLTRRR